MLFVENDRIYLTRGDDAVLHIALLQNGDTPYTMQPGDKITFTVRALPTVEERVLVRVSSATPRIVLRHEDTCELAVGRYSADVQLVTADGKRITVWPALEEAQRGRISNWKNITIMPEVTIE